MNKTSFSRILKAVLVSLLTIWLFLYWYLRNPQFSLGKNVTSSLAVEAKSIESRVRFISGIRPRRSFQNEASLVEARDYIHNKLKEYGYEVSLQEVRAAGRIFHNVIARYGKTDAKEILIIGAHYDVAGGANPGADDNASGVAGMLEIARLLKNQNPVLRLPVEFVAYTLEEPPFFGGSEMGSAIHALELRKSGVEVKAMVSLEMIGYFSDQMFSQHFPMPILYALFPLTGNFIGIVGRPEDRKFMSSFSKVLSANSTVPAVSINAPTFVQGIDYSDHRSYWNYNWPAIMITDTAFLRNDQYHKSGDTADRLNFTKAAEVVRGVYGAILNLAE